jgi:hypothetical protein
VDLLRGEFLALKVRVVGSDHFLVVHQEAVSRTSRLDAIPQLVEIRMRDRPDYRPRLAEVKAQLGLTDA